MDTRSIMAPLNAAAASLATIARSIGAKGAELRNTLHADHVRRQLLSAAEELRDAAQGAAMSARKAAAPYAQELAESAQQQMETLREGVASSAQVLARQMKKPASVISRHPYATAIIVAGACFVAVSQWRRRRIAHTGKPRAAAAKKSTNGASRSAARKRAAAAGSKAPAAVH